MINFTTRKLRILAPLVCTCLALPALAVAPADELKNQTEDMTNLVDAENAKSALCKSYVGKLVVPATFNALATTLPKRTVKGEFETTAQYQARIAATPNSGSANLSVLVLPVDRSFVRYDADMLFTTMDRSHPIKSSAEPRRQFMWAKQHQPSRMLAHPWNKVRSYVVA